MAKLSNTALVVLNNAAQRNDRLAELPLKLPTAARNAVASSLPKQGILERADGGTLHITDTCFRAVNLQPPKDATTATAPRSGLQESVGAAVGTSICSGDTALCASPNAAVGTLRPKLRDASHMVLDAWLQRDARPENLAVATDLLQFAMAAKLSWTGGATNAPWRPREGAKQQTVPRLLRLEEGTTIAQIVAATAWAQHTVRGFLANLKRKGIRSRCWNARARSARAARVARVPTASTELRTWAEDQPVTRTSPRYAIGLSRI